ncbi:PAS domain S-box protein [Desertibaculum subflavum]|uniref:PAS domain S-box protein n=1 Tax=Desertibaculum subflavum TaxID=2268458 RepID=UPI0034D1C9EB
MNSEAAEISEALRQRLGSEAFLDALPIGIYCCDREGIIRQFNRRAAELWGRAPNLGDAENHFCGSHCLYRPDGRILPADQSPMATALATGRQAKDVKAIFERPDGSRITVLANVEPLFDEAGRVIGAVNCFQDISELAEPQTEGHLAAIVASSDDAIVSKTLDGIIKSWNAGAERIFGYTAADMIGQPIIKIIPPELHAEEADILTRLRRGERIEHFETVRVAKSGRRLAISLTVSPILGANGQVIGASKVARDVTERKRAEELQQLLISELNHRVKNTLATVQSMASQTVRRAATPGDFVASFSGRLQSLARTHDLLTQSAWNGADLGSLARDQLVLGGPESGRIAFGGPQVLLEPQAALHLALVLHELGTNARKHGALSRPDGRVALHWDVRTTGSGGGKELRLHWQESGGPPVSVPSSHGFGTTLIEKSLSAHGGGATLHYRAEGVACDIALPLTDPGAGGVFAVPARDGALPPQAAAVPSLQGRRVLVVEDEALIALDIAATLEEAGCVVVGPASTLEQAKAEIHATSIDAALLDANLAGQPVDEVAEALAARAIPFAFLTGYGRQALPAAHRHAPLIRKPFVPREAIEVVGRLLAPDNRVVSLRPKGHSI